VNNNVFIILNFFERKPTLRRTGAGRVQRKGNVIFIHLRELSKRVLRRRGWPSGTKRETESCRFPRLNIVVRSSLRGSVALIDATTAGYKKGRRNLYEAQTLLPYNHYSVSSLLTALSSFRVGEREWQSLRKNGAGVLERQNASGFGHCDRLFRHPLAKNLLPHVPGSCGTDNYRAATSHNKRTRSVRYVSIFLAFVLYIYLFSSTTFN
jgi:hypothetical protein